MKPKYPIFLMGCVLAIGMGLASAENPPTPDQQEDYRHGYYPPPPPHHVYGYSYRY